MQQEPSSTVKHVNWVWPHCPVGNGAPSGDNSSRGLYNISVRQSFRLNGSDQYTIFDLPIQVTNEIKSQSVRLSCDALNNSLTNKTFLQQSANNFTCIAGTGLQTTGTGDSGSSGVGEPKPDASPKDDLGGAGILYWRTGCHWVWIAGLLFVFAL